MLEYATGTKGIKDVLDRSVMCLHEGAKTRVRMDLSEELEVKVGMHQGSALSMFPLAVLVDEEIELGRKGALCELLLADNLVLLIETIQ